MDISEKVCLENEIERLKSKLNDAEYRANMYCTIMRDHFNAIIYRAKEGLDALEEMRHDDTAYWLKTIIEDAEAIKNYKLIIKNN